ncbi:DUF7696 family protein [Roseateles depolymerans]|uniref:Uncharacterized protein n=1 Tax=Roseateles depolymerans TaxID=76731 RepID=A0A0U3LF55_9BURK|nr:hypothetical protein [Roseateles depolymerans]ALV06687.1 hypothetical protein RD2015_2215 [Roseateles depolymerans]REG19664.1 hypothetical protein DES44_2164 [Roseateles depolymerans]
MKTVTLITSQHVDSASEAWRAECAARYEEALRVARMATNRERRDHVDKVRASRGDLAADRLRAVAKQLIEGA